MTNCDLIAEIQQIAICKMFVRDMIYILCSANLSKIFILPLTLQLLQIGHGLRLRPSCY